MAAPQERVATRGFGAVDDVDDAPEFAYRDETGRRHEAAGSGLMIEFDSVEDYRAGRSGNGSPRQGRALLDVFVCTAETADATGVLLLDDRPVAAGDGRYQIEVPPGRHRIEVQGADAASGEFTAAAGERVCYTTGQSVAVRHHLDYRTQLYRVKDGSDHLPVLTGSAANANGLGCLAAVAGAIVVAASAVWFALAPEGTAKTVAGTLVVLGAIALVGGSVVGIAATRRLHRRAAAARVDPVHRTSGDALAFPSPEDLRTWRRDAASTGVAIVFDLYLYRLTRLSDGTAVYSGRQEPLALAHAARPRLRINDVEAPCDWAAWFYPLRAGTHRFDVEYGPDPFDGTTAHHEFEFAVPDRSDIAVLHVPVRVFRVWEQSGQRLTSLPPQIRHRLSKRSRTVVGKVDGNEGMDENWIPSRIWVD